MALVDLRGREDEPGVRELLIEAHGSANSPSLQRGLADYRSGEWKFVGWQEAGEIVACAGMDRAGTDIIVRSVAVAPERRGLGFGYALMDALADVAKGHGCERSVTETDEDAVDFYRRCGFSAEQAAPRYGRARFRCIRVITHEGGARNAAR